MEVENEKSLCGVGEAEQVWEHQVWVPEGEQPKQPIEAQEKEHTDGHPEPNDEQLPLRLGAGELHTAACCAVYYVTKEHQIDDQSGSEGRQEGVIESSTWHPADILWIPITVVEGGVICQHDDDRH